MDLIETRAVDVVGPDPADVGGIKELKWIAVCRPARYSYGSTAHLMVFGMAALTHVCNNAAELSPMNSREQIRLGWILKVCQIITFVMVM